MVEINLLAWRSQKYAYEARRVKQVLLMLLLFLCLQYTAIYGALHWFLDRAQYQLNKVRADVSEMMAMQQSYQVASHTINQDIQNKIEIHQENTLLLFQLNSAMRVKRVCLTELTRTKNRFIVTGRAGSILDLKSFLQHWAPTKKFSELQLSQLKLLSSEGVLQFRLLASEEAYAVK